MRFAIFVSGNGGFSQVLYYNQNLLGNGKLSLIIADRPCKALDFFQKKTNVPTFLVNYQDFKNKNEFEVEILKILNEWQIEYIFLTYNRLIGQVLLNAYRNRIINLHPSLLPLFKGLNSIQKAYHHDILFYGSTTHIVDESLDGGPILQQVCIGKNISDDEDVFTDKLFKLTAILFIDTIFKVTNIGFTIKDNKTFYKGIRYGTSPFNPDLSIQKDDVLFPK